MEENIEERIVDTVSFPCSNCGAYLKYMPGTDHMNCEYCGTGNEIPYEYGEVTENDYFEALQQGQGVVVTTSQHFIKCGSCGASSSRDGNVASSACPYCLTPMVDAEQGYDENIIMPGSLLPFKLDKPAAKEHFQKWIKGLWFAPNDLMKTDISADRFNGIYIPYWTYDTASFTQYEGQRGEYYYVTETYTENVNGQSVTKTRQVRHTRWHSVRGTVGVYFDDLLIPASKSLPKKYVEKLEPWDMENLVPYNKSYLSGFITEKYQVDIKEGFEIAKEMAEPKIREAIKNDIGGDDQRIGSITMNFSSITFKHLLFPVYVNVYKYNNKAYQFVVNARTGEVQGPRPYSWIKITLTILLVVTAIIAIVMAVQYYGDQPPA
jgi:LSD1 subclass zinc finger protein